MVRLGQGSKGQESTRATADGIAFDKTSDESTTANEIEHYGHLPVLACKELQTHAAR